MAVYSAFQALRSVLINVTSVSRSLNLQRVSVAYAAARCIWDLSFIHSEHTARAVLVLDIIERIQRPCLTADAR
jgi:CRISPR/Cas system-associated endonuclease Cas1